jgi:hypothetical protein
MKNFLNELQNKPYETRVRILWVTVGVIAVAIFIIWVMSVKSDISKLDTKNLLTIPTQSTNSNQTAVNYVNIERAEVAGQNLKLYFNFNNTTDDILNISKLTDITFNIDNQQINPTQILDRQGQTFVQKVLSHKQDFGILVFLNPHATTGTISFNQMFFEQTPDQKLTQTINIDLKQLEQLTKLRN